MLPVAASRSAATLPPDELTGWGALSHLPGFLPDRLPYCLDADSCARAVVACPTLGEWAPQESAWSTSGESDG